MSKPSRTPTQNNDFDVNALLSDVSNHARDMTTLTKKVKCLEDKLGSHEKIATTLSDTAINRFIKKEYRNKKIGSKLLKNLIFHSKRLGCYYIKSQVRKSNVACKKTLKKFGFKKTGYYPNGFDGDNLICYENYCKFLKKVKFN